MKFMTAYEKSKQMIESNPEIKFVKLYNNGFLKCFVEQRGDIMFTDRYFSSWDFMESNQWDIEV